MIDGQISASCAAHRAHRERFYQELLESGRGAGPRLPRKPRHAAAVGGARQHINQYSPGTRGLLQHGAGFFYAASVMPRRRRQIEGLGTSVAW